jgi:ADP-heptose:LPS heptosyltransferase
MNENKEIRELKTRVSLLEQHVDRMRIDHIERQLNARLIKPPLPQMRTEQTKKTKLVLCSNCSPGDIVMLTAAVRDLHVNHPNKFQTDVCTTAMQLWDNNPYVTRLNGWNETLVNTPNGLIKKITSNDKDIGVVECNYPLIDNSFGPDSGSNHSPHHFIHGYIRNLEDQLNIRIKPTKFKGDIHLSKAEKNWTSQAEEHGIKNFWIIIAGGKNDFTAKWWNPAYYQAVVDHFKDKINFVQCGEISNGHWHQPLKNVLDLRGKTDTRQFIRLMHHASGVVCPVTFAMHLAAAVETKGTPKNRACVVIAGGQEPSQWEAYPHHQYIHTNGALLCCDDGGCWCSRCQLIGDGDEKDEKNLCSNPIQITSELRIPKCMNMIAPEEVIRRIELYYEGGALQYAHA